MNVAFSEYDVSRDRAAAMEMVNLTGQMGVPVVVVDGQPVIGFNRPLLQELLSKSNGRQRPRLGMKVTDADRVSRKSGEPPVFGAIVGPVSPGSPADRAGIKAGDIITSINGTRINNVSELEKAISMYTSGSRVPVTFYRGDQAVKTEILL